MSTLISWVPGRGIGRPDVARRVRTAEGRRRADRLGAQVVGDGLQPRTNLDAVAEQTCGVRGVDLVGAEARLREPDLEVRREVDQGDVTLRLDVHRGDGEVGVMEGALGSSPSSAPRPSPGTSSGKQVMPSCDHSPVGAGQVGVPLTIYFSDGRRRRQGQALFLRVSAHIVPPRAGTGCPSQLDRGGPHTRRRTRIHTKDRPRLAYVVCGDSLRSIGDRTRRPRPAVVALPDSRRDSGECRAGREGTAEHREGRRLTAIRRSTQPRPLLPL